VESVSSLFLVIFLAALNFALLVIFMTRLEREITGKVTELGESRNELQILYDAFSETVGSIDLEELLPRIIDLVHHRLRADMVAIYLREPGEESIVLVAQRGLDAKGIDVLMRPQVERSASWRAFHDRRSAIWRIEDYKEGAVKEVLEEHGIAIVGSFPLAARGESLGALTLGYRDAGLLDDSRIALLETLTLQLGAIVRSAALHDQLDRANARLDNLASTDTLTGLANRRAAMRALDREVARAKRFAGMLAVIMCDIDHFKEFNDTYGHDCGDYVLANLAQIFTDTVRSTDLASRWGGEEFLIVLGSASPEGALGFAERLRAKVELAVWDFGGKRLSVTITLGVAISTPEAGGEAAISLADAALYEGKRAGRNRVVLRDSEETPIPHLEPDLADLEGGPRRDEDEIADLLPE
jgi:diguanylate cyclase (GGDEF)-like protein